MPAASHDLIKKRAKVLSQSKNTENTCEMTSFFVCVFFVLFLGE